MTVAKLVGMTEGKVLWVSRLHVVFIFIFFVVCVCCELQQRQQGVYTPTPNQC